MQPLWLVGSGSMAQQYVPVLESLGVPFEVKGRGFDSALRFKKATGYEVATGGVEEAIDGGEHPKEAIVAVGVEELARTTAALVRAGVKRILVEKPAGLDLSQLNKLAYATAEHNASVFVAYNRRFYGSVRQAREYLLEDGGVLSARFEFTEWAHVIQPLKKSPGVKERWLLGNSSHVLDLAFHLIGRPLDIKSWRSGSIDWHPAAARFVGAGVSVKNVLFSYLADWQAPGRWSLELLTKRRRLIFEPMEHLQVISLGSSIKELVEPMDNYDQTFKPGLYLQTKAFLSRDDFLLCSMSEQVENIRTFSELAGY